MLKRMIDVSKSSKPFSSDELEALAADAATRNRGLGVTGMLMSSGGIFYEVLEGPVDSVNNLFHKIALDPRHNDVVVLTVQEEDECLHGTKNASRRGLSIPVAVPQYLSLDHHAQYDQQRCSAADVLNKVLPAT